MTVLDGLNEVARRLEGRAERRFRAAAAAIVRHAVAHPRPLFALLRTVKPVLLIDGIALVTRYDDVVEVLTHDQVFGVEPYRAKMRRLCGEFILGTDDAPAYERAISILRLSAPRSDMPALAAFVTETAESEVARRDGRVDVADLTKRVPARLAARWLGVTSPDEDTLVAWTLDLFNEIFVNVRDNPAIAAAADRAAAGLRPRLDGEIAARKGAGPAADVLGRLVAMQATTETALNDEEIRSNLFGLLVGFIPTVAMATTLAIDHLLDRPDALASAQGAARADDDDAVRAHVWEAMRLAPQGPGLLRRSMRDFVVAEGSRHATRIPAGTTMFAATQSAMLDRRVVHRPEDFRPNRPAHHYLHFGAGRHTCFGRFASAMQIPLIAKAVLRRPGLARAPGEAGRLSRAGPFPASLTVTYDTG
jgi:cytochrome P450